MASLFDTIPGYREAVKRESDSRDFALLGADEIVAGVPVRPLTVRHMLLLDLSGNAFVTHGRVPTHRDIVSFLWICSPDYKPDNDALAKFSMGMGGLDYGESVKAILDHIRESVQDAPAAHSRPDAPSNWSWAAIIVDTIATEYHWSLDAILDLPMKAVFQFVKIISKRRNPRAAVFNPSDKVRGDWLRSEAEKN